MTIDVLICLIFIMGTIFESLLESAREKEGYEKIKIILAFTIVIIGGIIFFNIFNEYYILKETVNTCLQILQYNK